MKKPKIDTPKAPRGDRHDSHGSHHDDKPQDFLHEKHGHDGEIIVWSASSSKLLAPAFSDQAEPEPSWVSDPAVGPTMMDFLNWASYHPIETAVIPDEFLVMTDPDGVKAMADWTEEHDAYVAYYASLETEPPAEPPVIIIVDDVPGDAGGGGGDLTGEAPGWDWTPMENTVPEAYRDWNQETGAPPAWWPVPVEIVGVPAVDDTAILP